jgi:uncharacterized protein (TIGR03435 family)
MKRSRLRIALTALVLSGIAFAQPPKPALLFENADVHVTPPGGRTNGGRFRPGVRYEADGFTLLNLICRAFGITDSDKVVGGPAWLATDKFDILAEVPDGVPPAAVQPMLQALLSDRFKLSVHKGREPIPAYALTAGKGLRLKEAASGGDSTCNDKWADSFLSLTCHNMTVEQFAQNLYDTAMGDFDHSLVDKTGLTAKYDFNLHWTPLWQLGRPDASGKTTGLSVLDAIEKQLGLKLELRKEPVPVVVIDHVNRIPTPNAPGVTAALQAPAHTEFEAAEVRAHKPGAPFSFNTYETRVEIHGLRLRDLIYEAYGVRGEELADAPKWMDTEGFDVIAKSATRLPWENMQVMLQNLIVERFKLTFHKEDRPVPVYALTLGKRTANLRNADPTKRSSCRKRGGDGGLTFTCQSTTLSQFAEKVRDAAAGDVNLPVVDLTGLTGVFDFSLTWTPGGRASAAGREDDARPAAGIVDASTPTGELSFFEAVQKQLGLKVQQQRHPMPVMVIDHVERPAEN